VTKGKQFQKWMKITTEEFVQRIKDPDLRHALIDVWLPDFSLFFILATFAYLHNKNAGYPIGGRCLCRWRWQSVTLRWAVEIYYGRRVEKILVEGDRAVGVRLADGTQQRAAG